MTVDLAAAITIVIARPFMHAVADRRMRRMTATVALPFIGVEDRARNRDICRDQVVTGVFGRVVADPKTALARVPRDDADDGRPVIGEGAMAFALIGPPPGRILRVRMGRTFFPLRSGTAHRPQRRCRSSYQSGRWRSG